MAEHVPTIETRAKVDALAAFGVPHKKIAKYLKIREQTLTTLYAEELELAGIDKLIQVGHALFQKAIEGNMTAAIFYLKTKGGWREYEKDELKAMEPVNKIQIEVINGKGEIKSE